MGADDRVGTKDREGTNVGGEFVGFKLKDGRKVGIAVDGLSDNVGNVDGNNVGELVGWPQQILVHKFNRK